MGVLMADRDDLNMVYELRVIRRLLALSLIEGKKNRESIAILASAGMDRHEIAELVGTTANTVSVEISTQKKLKSRGQHGGRSEN
jgi:CRP-like cAMP-binding protein